MNRVGVAGAALLVLLSLTGCSPWFPQHDVADDHQDEVSDGRESDVAEEPLREQIGDLASVVEVGSTVDHMFGITSFYVWVVVSDLVEGDLHTIVASVDELLEKRDVSFELYFNDVRLLSIGYPHDFSADELVTEVKYWLALSEANDAPLGMNLHNSIYGSYRNIWDPDQTDLLDWDALRAVPDPSTAYGTYFLDDLVATNSMPTPDVLAFRDRLAAIEVREDEAVSLESYAPGYVLVRYFSPEAGASDPTPLASWPRVREVVSEMAALGLPQSNFVFSTEWFKDGASLHLGECVVLQDENEGWASGELADALANSGIEFPVGMGSGFCNDADA